MSRAGKIFYFLGPLVQKFSGTNSPSIFWDHWSKNFLGLIFSTANFHLNLAIFLQDVLKQQVETRTKDGRRRITPLFVAAQVDIGFVTWLYFTLVFHFNHIVSYRTVPYRTVPYRTVVFSFVPKSLVPL